MKKAMSILLALIMVLSLLPFALAEEADLQSEEEAGPTPLEIALNFRPVSDEPTHITVGNTTKVKGSFFTTYFGNNTSDIDVRTMLHGYSPVVWDNQQQFVEDPMVVRSVIKANGPEGPVYTVSLQRDLVYNDGTTPITAEDYVFSWLLTCSPELTAIGAETPKVEIVGFDAFHSGETPYFRGIRLLDEDGWVLNECGDPYNPAFDALRYKEVDGVLMPLSLRFAKCRDNPSADMVVALYSETLPQIGAKIRVEEVEFNDLLADYYRDGSSRRYDMNFMATNFVSTFDPYLVFSGREDLQGAVNTSGIVDDELVSLAFQMRSTTPGDALTFINRWIEMQQRYNELLPTMPIYSNVYFDFHTDWLQYYYPNAEYSWPVAILYAFYGEPAEEEVEEEIVSDMEDEVFFEADTQPAEEASAISLDWDSLIQAILEEYDEASFTAENASAVPADVPAVVTEPISPAPVSAASQDASDAPVTVSVVTTLQPKNGVAYRPGEMITFMVTAVNHTGHTLRNLTITEGASGKSFFQFDFLHGAKVPFLATYTVTEADAQRGFIHTEVTASCVSYSGEQLAAGPVAADFPASF